MFIVRISEIGALFRNVCVPSQACSEIRAKLKKSLDFTAAVSLIRSAFLSITTKKKERQTYRSVSERTTAREGGCLIDPYVAPGQCVKLAQWRSGIRFMIWTFIAGKNLLESPSLLFSARWKHQRHSRVAGPGKELSTLLSDSVVLDCERDRVHMFEPTPMVTAFVPTNGTNALGS
jgi:hypothetical protein